MATALSYQTLLALVPLVVLALSLLTYVDAFYSLQDDIIFFLFDNLLPATIVHVYDILQDIILNAGELTFFSLIGLALTALLLFQSIEASFTQIWQAKTTRNIFKRITAYSLLLLAGPVALASSLTLVRWIASLTEEASGISLQAYVDYFRFLIPFLITFFILWLLYRLVPVRLVLWSHAAIGAAFSASLFVAGKYFFKLYLMLFPSYQMIYGALSILPLFLIWLYVCWILVLLGATITAVLGFNYKADLSPRENPKDVNELPGTEC